MTNWNSPSASSEVSSRRSASFLQEQKAEDYIGPNGLMMAAPITVTGTTLAPGAGRAECHAHARRAVRRHHQHQTRPARDLERPRVGRPAQQQAHADALENRARDDQARAARASRQGRRRRPSARHLAQRPLPEAPATRPLASTFAPTVRRKIWPYAEGLGV